MERDGFSAPFRVVDEITMSGYRRAFDALFAAPGRAAHTPLQSRHLDAPVVHSLCTHPAILEHVHAALGPSVVLWRSNFYRKQPGEGEIAWHRDRDHWKHLLEPMRNVTAWIAIDAATTESGCLEFRLDGEHAIPVELAPGECVLFDQDAWHRSGPNRSTTRRLGLAVRFTLPDVRIAPGRAIGPTGTLRLDA